MLFYLLHAVLLGSWISISHCQDPHVFSLTLVPFSVSACSTTPSNSSLDLKRRDLVSTVVYQYLHTMYLAEISIGTPAQTIYLPIDTSAGDTWTVGSYSACSANASYCPYFNSSASSTFSSLSENFTLPSLDDSSSVEATGAYAADVVKFANQTFESFQFGLADASASSGYGALGLGMIFNEQSEAQYANLPLRLRSNNVTQVNLYSLWLNSVQASSGSLLFGGIDRGKFTGELEVFNFRPLETGSYLEPNISISKISVRSSTTSDEITVMGENSTNSTLSNMVVYSVIDSGTLESRLPDSVLKPLAALFGTTGFDSRYNMYMYDCDSIPDQYSIILEFESSLEIEISVAESFYQVGDSCVLGIMPTSETSIIGQTFLRSMYVALDYDNYKVGLAQAYFNSDLTSVQELDDSGIPTGITGLGASSSATGTTATTNNVVTTLSLPTNAAAQTTTTAAAQSGSLFATTLVTAQATTTVSDGEVVTIPTPVTTILGETNGVVLVSGAQSVKVEVSARLIHLYGIVLGVCIYGILMC
ncbi:aspartic peptidase domain-containing protein [Myxozyma melibiosi]|uniref:Aspartic peptidase domain-containing protein n=1 Tax=Myxozyma melibiosi TaxID=54550 RepID=A0ABR1F1T1_9ASCO